MANIGERLKELRLRAGLSQEELGKIIGVGRQCIWKYENGIVKTLKQPQIKALADYFSVTPSYILCLEDEVRTQRDDVQDLLEALRSRPEMKMLFSVTKNATKEDILKAVAILEALKASNE